MVCQINSRASHLSFWSAAVYFAKMVKRMCSGKKLPTSTLGRIKNEFVPIVTGFDSFLCRSTRARFRFFTVFVIRLHSRDSNCSLMSVRYWGRCLFCVFQSAILGLSTTGKKLSKITNGARAFIVSELKVFCFLTIKGNYNLCVRSNSPAMHTRKSP